MIPRNFDKKLREHRFLEREFSGLEVTEIELTSFVKRLRHKQII